MTPRNAHRIPDKPPTLADLGELGLLRQVRRWFTTEASTVELGIGDDAALLRTGRRTVVTTDTLVEGVHFRHATINPRELGRKALVVNLSDVASMAARPLAAFLALSLPPDAPLAQVRGFFAGLRSATQEFSCPLAGGDLTRAPQWMINITILGEPVAKRVALRSAARPGDTVYVTGWPGESGAALWALEHSQHAPFPLLARHRRPMPRLAEAALLAQRSPRLAMLDVSDGVWNEAHQLAAASGVAVELWRDTLPVSSRLRRWCGWQGLDPIDFVLFGGEDYELLLASPLPPEQLGFELLAGGKRVALHPIGRVREGRGVKLVDPAGQSVRVGQGGFRHF